MRVWPLTAAGLDHLALTDRPDPEPGDGDVVVRIRAALLKIEQLKKGLHFGKIAIAF